MKLKIFGFLILAVITNSCANSNKLTTISDGLTQTCIDEKPQWVELAQNQGVYRCVSDIKTRYTTTTVYVAPKPTATQELPGQNVQGCDAVKNAILNIVDFYRFGNTQSHSQSQLENHVRTISSFLRGIDFWMEANGVDNATSLGDVLFLSQNIVEQKCGI